MKEVRYMISDAAKKLNVEPHVLRYWEEELGTEIPRNEMGHRYYHEEDIRMMQGVKYLKEKGFQLKSIKILLPEVDKAMQLPQRRLLELRDRLELAVSQEELRLQREEELKNYSGQEQGSEEGEADVKPPLSEQVSGENGLGVDEQKMPDGEAQRDLYAAAGKVDKPENPVLAGEAEKPENPVLTGEETDWRKGGLSVEAGTKEEIDGMSVKTGVDGHTDGILAGTKQDRQGKDVLGRKEPDEPNNSVVPEKNELQESKPENTPVSVSDSAERMRQFRRIMNEIITDVMRENNKELTGKITASVSRELEYHMRKREMAQEEHFKQLDRTLREYQMGQKQAAVAKECGSRRESKFFKKNGKVRI